MEEHLRHHPLPPHPRGREIEPTHQEIVERLDSMERLLRDIEKRI